MLVGSDWFSLGFCSPLNLSLWPRICSVLTGYLPIPGAREWDQPHLTVKDLQVDEEGRGGSKGKWFHKWKPQCFLQNRGDGVLGRKTCPSHLYTKVPTGLEYLFLVVCQVVCGRAAADQRLCRSFLGCWLLLRIKWKHVERFWREKWHDLTYT